MSTTNIELSIELKNAIEAHIKYRSKNGTYKSITELQKRSQSYRIYHENVDTNEYPWTEEINEAMAVEMTLHDNASYSRHVEAMCLAQYRM